MKTATSIKVTARLEIYGDYTQDQLKAILTKLDNRILATNTGERLAMFTLSTAEVTHYINH